MHFLLGWSIFKFPSSMKLYKIRERRRNARVEVGVGVEWGWGLDGGGVGVRWGWGNYSNWNCIFMHNGNLKG